MTTTLNAAEWISATCTAVIAIATIIYVVYTRGLWRETKKSADAAKRAADAATASAEATRVTAQAAKTSADITAAMHQPVIEIANVEFAKLQGAPINYNPLAAGLLDLQITLKNYGLASAFNVEVDIRAGVRNRKNNRMPKSGMQLAPSSECPISISVTIPPEDFKRIREGEIYSVDITCTYTTPDGQKRYRYETERVLSPHDCSFTAETNSTTQLNP